MAGHAEVPLGTSLRGIVVVEAGVGMCSALIGKFFAEAGAKVIRVECDGDEIFWDRYPAYAVWHSSKESRRCSSKEELLSLAAAADVLILGGEDAPGLERVCDSATIAAKCPAAVVLEISGYPAGSLHEGRPAIDLLVQARSGLCYEHYSDRPIAWAFPAPAYGAVLRGLVAVLGALYMRERTGKGQIVSISLFEGAVGWCTPYWFVAENPGSAFDNLEPKGVVPLIMRCSDESYVHLSFGTPGSKSRLYDLLGIPVKVDPMDRGLPASGASIRNYFGDIDLMEPYVRQWKSDELLNAMAENDVLAAPVLAPGEVWARPQVRANGIIREDESGVRYVAWPGRATWTHTSELQRPPAAENQSELGMAPLAGLRIIDLGAFIAGPYASLPLSDLGADVIKVEPLTGEAGRFDFPSFATANRGKRAVAVDMKTPQGREIVHKLCRYANVVHYNFRKGVAERLGLDPATLHDINPSLIVLSTASYGASGPDAHRPGFDMLFQALSGLEHRAGGDGNAPMWHRQYLIDYGAGLLGSISILGALIHRLRSGTGASLTLSLLDAGLFLNSELIQRHDGSFARLRSLDSDQLGFHPAERLYFANDGCVAIAAIGESMAKRLVRALGLADEITQPRSSWGKDEVAAISRVIATMRGADLVNTLTREDVWAEICRRDGEAALMTAPPNEAAGPLAVWHDAELGDVRQIGTMYSASESSLAKRRGPPPLGADTRNILAELGYSSSEIERMFSDRIVA